jgi:hypothetical protein
MQLYVLAIMRALAASHKAAITNRRKHAKGLYKALYSSLKRGSKTLQSRHGQVQAQNVLGRPFKDFQMPIKTLHKSSFKGYCKGLYKAVEEAFYRLAVDAKHGYFQRMQLHVFSNRRILSVQLLLSAASVH